LSPYYSSYPVSATEELDIKFKKPFSASASVALDVSYNPNEPVKHFQASLKKKKTEKSGTFAKISACGDAAFGAVAEHELF